MTPSDIIVKEKGRLLVLVYPDKTQIELAAEYLRVESPSAEVQGHNAREKKLVSGKKDVSITGAEPVGNYAVRLIFSDGHSSGIFTWSGLSDMARDHDEIWSKYLTLLNEKGLTRG